MTKDKILAHLQLQIEYEDKSIRECLKDLSACAQRGADLSDEIRKLSALNASHLSLYAQREIISKLDN